MKIVLVAEESAGVQTLRALSATDHELVGVLTTEPTRGGGATVASAAEAAGVPVVQSAQVQDPGLGTWIRQQGVDLLLNVHSLYVIHAEVVRAPRIGSFNVHPGPLPQYAGLNAPSWAIFNGESSHAVTVHWMAEGIDTGPIAYTTPFDVGESDTALFVAARCARESVPLLMRLVDTAAADPSSIPRVEQDVRERRYYGREVPNGGRIRWDRPAREIVDFVRACDYAPFPSPWGHPRALLRGRELHLLKAERSGEPADRRPGTVGMVESGWAEVAAADEWIRVGRLRLDGARADAGAVLAAGDRLEDGE